MTSWNLRMLSLYQLICFRVVFFFQQRFIVLKNTIERYALTTKIFYWSAIVSIAFGVSNFGIYPLTNLSRRGRVACRRWSAITPCDRWLVTKLWYSMKYSEVDLWFRKSWISCEAIDERRREWHHMPSLKFQVIVSLYHLVVRIHFHNIIQLINTSTWCYTFTVVFLHFFLNQINNFAIVNVWWVKTNKHIVDGYAVS